MIVTYKNCLFLHLFSGMNEKFAFVYFSQVLLLCIVHFIFELIWKLIFRLYEVTRLI